MIYELLVITTSLKMSKYKTLYIKVNMSQL